MNTRLILITVIASIGGLLFGYDTGVINGTQYVLSKNFDLTGLEKGRSEYYIAHAQGDDCDLYGQTHEIKGT